jgi:hypothetical protein
MALTRSDPDAAREVYGEALPPYRRLGHGRGEVACIEKLQGLTE